MTDRRMTTRSTRTVSTTNTHHLLAKEQALSRNMSSYGIKLLQVMVTTEASCLY